MASNTERVKRFRAKAKENGFIRRDYYATKEEHEALAAKLKAIRAKIKKYLTEEK